MLARILNRAGPVARGAERRAQDVDCEVEQATSAAGVALGPEQCHSPVAGKRLRPSGDDERQQCDPVALGRWPAEGSISGTQGRAPEKLDRDHRVSPPANSWLIPSARSS